MSVADGIGAGRTSRFRSVLRRVLAARRSRISPVQQDVNSISESGMFDRAGYLARYPDVAATAMDPIKHYVTSGAAEHRDPCELFDTSYYIESNPDVAASGINPLRHFYEHGWKEGRVPSEKFDVVAYAAARLASNGSVLPLDAFRLPKSGKMSHTVEFPSYEKTASRNYSIIAGSGVFDREFYLQAYPGVASAGVDPIVHYIQYGARERRNPSSLFDTDYYLRNNPDVEKAGVNPLVHFCEHGWKEFRKPSKRFVTAWCWLNQLAETGVDSNPLSRCLAKDEAVPLLREPPSRSSADEKDSVSNIVDRLIQQEHHDVGHVKRIGHALIQLSRWAEAEIVLRLASGLSRDDASVHATLAEILVKQGKWWQAVESLNMATTLDPDQARLFHHLGHAQEQMNNFALAAQAFEKAVVLNPGDPIWNYRLGFASEKAGLHDVAGKSYAEAIHQDGRGFVKRCGVGVFHQDRGLWAEAAKAYATRLDDTPLSAELHYRLGMAHDRCYRWEEARSSYCDAISLDSTVPYWHYRLGFVLERLERWCEAAEAYGAAAAMSEKSAPYWWYRQGQVLVRAGLYEDACLAYIKTSDNQTLDGSVHINLDGSGAEPADPKPYEAYLRKFSKKRLSEMVVSRAPAEATGHYQLGEAYEAEEEWDAASNAYSRALERSDDHCPAWYYRLGFVLFLACRYREACEAFVETRVLRRAFGVDLAPYQKPGVLRDVVEYNEYYHTLPIKERTIVYESFHGLSVGCNPLAMFEQVLDALEFSQWTHVWVINEKDQIPERYRTRENVVFVSRGSDLYRRYLASASHLINNNTFPSWFVRRPDQRYLNTWHGTPLKSLGKDIRGDFMAHRNAARNLLHATHVLSPNTHTSDVLIGRNDINGVFRGLLAETGYPRVDKVVNATHEDRAELRSELGLAQGIPVVLYAPTWRGVLGAVKTDVAQLKKDVAAMAGLECQVLFRGHHMVEHLVAEADLPAIVVPAEVDTNDLLSIVDVLITDYSSVWFDFLPTGRPILYYAYDLDEYTSDRGLYFDLDDMPGKLCRTRDNLVTAMEVALVQTEVDSRAYAEGQRRFSPYEDGAATERAIDFFFHASMEHVVHRYSDERRAVMMYSGGFIPNGITTSCLNLLQSFDRNEYRLVVAIDPASVKATDERIEKFDAIPADVQVLARVGGTNWSPEERWVSGVFSKYHEFPSAAARDVYQTAYRHEYLRVFGYNSLDCLVQFDGYVNFWTSAFAFGGEGAVDRVIYLHNDMKGEYETRFPLLKGTFALYPEYDKLVSVSESVHDFNRMNLCSEYGLDSSRFSYCNNLMNVESIIKKAKCDLDAGIAGWVGDDLLFATLGRLSPEKGHGKLISAFHEVVKKFDRKLKLAIAGDGPLKHELQAQIEELGLQDRVRLVGQISNPYPLLQRSDLFVFSSDYEGQGIAVLEALALGKPVVSTDVVGPRTILTGGYGLLVENSVAGLVEGMDSFLRSEIKFTAFDAWKYEREALDMFELTISSVGGLAATTIKSQERDEVRCK